MTTIEQTKPTQLTPAQLREHATEIMIDAARDVVRLSVREHCAEYDINPSPEDVTAIMNLINDAAIDISWPDAAAKETGR